MKKTAILFCLFAAALLICATFAYGPAILAGALLGGGTVAIPLLRYRKKARSEMELNQLLTTIFDNLPCSIFVKEFDKNDAYLLGNRHYRELLKLPEGALQGKTDFDLYSDKMAHHYVEDDARAMQTGEIHEIIETLPLPGDAPSQIVRTRKVKLARPGRGDLLVGISFDISETHQMEEELRAYAEQDRIINGCLSALASNVDFDRTLQEVLHKLVEPCCADYCGIVRIKEDNKTVELVNDWHSEYIQIPETHIFPLDPSNKLFRTLAEHRIFKLLDLDNVPAGEVTNLELYRRLGFRSLLAAGIRDEGRLCGFLLLAFAREKRHDSKLDERFMKAAADTIEIALARRRNFELIAASEREKSLIFDNIDIPVMFFDAEGKLLSLNKATSRWRGKSEAELLAGPCYRTFCDSEDYPEYCPVQQVLKTHRPYHYEYCNPATKHSFSGSVVPIFDEHGKLRNLVESVVDTTAQTEAKEQIIRAREAAEAANRAKSTFLATMSHEIRTPLNAIIGLSELLAGDETLPPEPAEHIRSIHLAGQSLLTLINDVLEISKIEADKLEIEFDWMRLDQLLEGNFRIFQPIASRKHLKLEFITPPDLPEVLLNEIRLRQVLFNLIGNAVKFTQAGEIRLKTELQPVEEGVATLRISVSDTGIGIRPEDRERIFQPFEQAEVYVRGTRSSEGSGLGLAIALRLVDKMGGTLTLESTPGKGSSFTVIFPAVRCRFPVETPKLPPPAPATGSDRCAWVVDDVPLNCSVLAKMLSLAGFRCSTMNSGPEALEKLGSAPAPEFIFTDLWMPQMNGAEFAAEVHARYPEIHLVAVTADTEAENNFCLDLFCGLLLKPVTLKKIREFLQDAEAKKSRILPGSVQ